MTQFNENIKNFYEKLNSLCLGIIQLPVLAFILKLALVCECICFNDKLFILSLYAGMIML